jgi:hypothetical protein
MNRLDAAREWYRVQDRRLLAIDNWMRERPPVPKQLNALIAPYYDKKLGRELLKRERIEIERMALVRLFADFEAAFRDSFALWLKTKIDIACPDPRGLRTAIGIHNVLPDSIDACLNMFRSLEPKFLGSEKNWLDKLRAFRNDVMHGGFAEVDPVGDPVEAYENLTRILSYLEVS